MAFSQSQQHLYGQQQVNMQQRFHQQALSAPSLPDLMAEHQKQWHDHLVMTGSAQNLHVNPQQMQQNDFNTNNNNNNYSPQQIAMWQQRYQQQQNVSHSAMNITHYQQIMAQQQQQQQQQMMYQMQQQQQQQQQPQPQQYLSPRTLFQQQARNNTNQNCYASTGQLTTNNNNYNNNNRNFMSQTGITDMEQLDEFEEKEESVDHEHDSFVPPAPQNNQEIKKYVNWQAKRKGIDDEKRITLEVVKRQNVSAQNLYNVSAKNSNNVCAKKDSFDDIYKSNNSNIIYESWLNKKGKINKAMQLRYCKAFKDRKLAYFQRAGDKEKKGFVDLTQVSGINMYLPKIFESKKNDIMDVNKIKQDAVNGFCPFKLKTVSLKGNKNSFGFELVTNKRVWVFSCADSGVFKKWMSVLKRLCFGKCFHSGYLRKTGPKYKSWKRRFFVIYDWNEMRYFEDDTLSVQKGMIELNKITKISAAKPKQYNYANCIELHTPQRIWVLETETNQNREVWLNGIRNIVS